MASRPPLLNRPFVLVWVAGFLQEFQWSLLVQFPGFLAEFVTESWIGVLYATSAIVALVLRPFVGRLLDEAGRRRVLLVGGVVNSAALLAFVLVESFGAWLFALFVVHRVMQIVLFTAMMTFSADIVPEARRTEGLALLGLAGLLPLATGGLAGDGILALGGFDLLFIAAAASGLLSWLVVWQLPRRVLPGGGPARRGFFAALVQRDLLPVWLVGLLFALGLEVAFTYLRTFVDDREVGSVGLFFVSYGIAAIAARLLSSSRLDLVPARLLLVASISGYAVAYALLAAAQSLVPFVVAAFLAGIAHGVAFPVIAAQVVTRARLAERGSAMTIFTAIFDVALLGSAPVVGALIDFQGYAVAFRATAGVLAVGTLVYAVWDRRVAAADPDRSRV